MSKAVIATGLNDCRRNRQTAIGGVGVDTIPCVRYTIPVGSFQRTDATGRGFLYGWQGAFT
ncbi:hypothetical protein NBG4_890009 [Candidatus Sulfobium mesophilum]|uniref:Uncharacterized protein n=1 Tax=Candidatus Sulfobium mesophilum TaxID=2016548 RepID=A0A2U3QKV5_9BACT|nr:hypothetical protein NBG4_890009 [Candidatus Sulfobium mesophilum]